MFISQAFAQDTTAAAQQGPSALMTMAPLIVIFALFYLLVIRPQSKRIREHGELLKQLKAGDQVITGGGFYGKIIKVEENDFVIEIAPSVQVKAQKHTVTALKEVVADIKPVK